MENNFADAGVFLVRTFFGFYTIALLLRFLMHAVHADFYNPISQAIVQITSPALMPLHRIIPVLYRFDLSCLILALAVQLAALLLIFSISQVSLPDFGTLVSWGLVGLLALTLDIYYFSLIIMVVASWVAPYQANPALVLVQQLNEPLCAPARRLLPPVGGLDLSVMLVFVSLILLDNFFLVTPLKQILGVPRGLLLGL